MHAVNDSNELINFQQMAKYINPHPSNILILYTDGFSGQQNGELNYIADRLEKQFIISKHLPAKEIFSRVKEDFMSYCGAPDDDATMILIKKL
jgi:serine phosphatase RsbU (regulator of sigma subunit)